MEDQTSIDSATFIRSHNSQPICHQPLICQLYPFFGSSRILLMNLMWVWLESANRWLGHDHHLCAGWVYLEPSLSSSGLSSVRPSTFLHLPVLTLLQTPSLTCAFHVGFSRIRVFHESFRIALCQILFLAVRFRVLISFSGGLSLSLLYSHLFLLPPKASPGSDLTSSSVDFSPRQFHQIKSSKTHFHSLLIDELPWFFATQHQFNSLNTLQLPFSFSSSCFLFPVPRSSHQLMLVQ